MIGTLSSLFAGIVCLAGCELETACRPVDRMTPLVFPGEIRQGVQVAAPGGGSQSFSAWFMAQGAGKGDKPYDRLVQTPDWYLHTMAAPKEVGPLVFGYTDEKGEIVGIGGLGAGEGIFFGKWQHVAVTYGSEGFAVYLNGRLVSAKRLHKSKSRGNLTGGMACLANTSVGGNRPFCGLLADVRFFSRTLSAAEIERMSRVNPDGRAIELPPSSLPTADDLVPVVDISGDAARQVVIVEGSKDRYEGHPTTLLADDGKTVFCVWTTGHGGPCGQMARSDDAGLTWTRLDASLPPVYGRTHRNCPVLQKAHLPNGKTRYFVFSAKASEGTGLGILVSDDFGKTWYESPCQPHLSAGMPPTGFMELKDGTLALFGQMFKDKGQAKDRPTDDQAVWMSVSTDGGLTWGPARAVAAAESRNLCEPCCLRSPDGASLALVMRENRHKGRSMICFSQDEGKTWSKPVDTPWALTGDRHEGVMLPDGRYVIAFRDQAVGSETRGQFMAWVGTWDDLEKGRPGQYRIHLLHHHGLPGKWPGSPIDTGYPGVELLPDGTILCTTYTRHFDDDRQSSVVMTRFRIAETDLRIGFSPPSRMSQGKIAPLASAFPTSGTNDLL